MLALIVPSAAQPELFYQFLRLRDAWPRQAVEIKGSKLDEAQTAQVISLLASHGSIAEYYAIDMVFHPNDVIDELKERQAAAITANLTSEHSGQVVRTAHDDANAIRSLANPLFVQAFMCIQLVLDMLDILINWFAQRRPEELERFAWIIDRKDQTETRMERLWSTLMMPIGESRSAKQPYARVHGFDYTYFAKFEVDETTATEEMKRHASWIRKTLLESQARPLRFIDAKRIWTEERMFEDSKNSLGLQLADIVATTLCRALNGNLQQSGWKPLSRLLIRKGTAPFLQLGKAAGGRHAPLERRAAGVWRILHTNSLEMIRDSI